MSIKDRLKIRAEIISSNHDFFVSSINDVSSIITNSLTKNKKLMFCGNGGSAAESQHMAAEYCATLNHKNFRSGMAAISLTVDTSFITAWSNDFGYLEVFSRQIEALGDKDDVAIGITTSGKSKNVINAIKTAKKKGLKCVVFTGNYTRLVSGFCDEIRLR